MFITRYITSCRATCDDLDNFSLSLSTTWVPLDNCLDSCGFDTSWLTAHVEVNLLFLILYHLRRIFSNCIMYLFDRISLDSPSPLRWFVSFIVPIIMIIHGYTKKHLDITGVIAGKILLLLNVWLRLHFNNTGIYCHSPVYVIHLIQITNINNLFFYFLLPSFLLLAFIVGFFLTLSNYCFMTCMLAFFLTSSRATKYMGHLKRKVEADYEKSSRRNWFVFMLLPRFVLRKLSLITWNLLWTFTNYLNFVQAPSRV